MELAVRFPGQATKSRARRQSSPAPRFLWTSVWEHEEFHKEVSE
jgi:hypothetical protein